MRLSVGLCLLLILCLWATGCARAQPSTVARGSVEEFVKVTPCQLQAAPGSYNRRLVEVTGFVSHGFEDFALFDPQCSTGIGIWLEYGGTTASGTMYCCGVTAERSRPEPLVVEDISIPLVDDERFKQFDELLHGRTDAIVHATIRGRFFPGEEQKYEGRTFWGGYGHMGCCMMLAIQQVVSVDPHDRTDLDYRATAEQPKMDKVGCGYKYLTPLERFPGSIKSQQQAETEEREWAFNDPQRVAAEGLAQFIQIDEKSITGMRQTGSAQGRFIYNWRSPGREGKSYMVVVSRPYVLSFYAKDPKRVAWTVIAAYESHCDGRTAMRRVSVQPARRRPANRRAIH